MARIEGVVLRPPSIEERRRAAALQELAENLRDGSSDGTAYTRVVRAVGSGWVEIQADYLEHLLGRIEDEMQAGGG